MQPLLHAVPLDHSVMKLLVREGTLCSPLGALMKETILLLLLLMHHYGPEAVGEDLMRDEFPVMAQRTKYSAKNVAISLNGTITLE